MNPNEALGGPPSLPSVVRSPEIIPGAIQRFADTGLQASIEQAMRQLPPDAHGAVIGYERNGTFGLATVAKLGPHWSVVMAIDKPKGQGFSHEGAVRFMW